MLRSTIDVTLKSPPSNHRCAVWLQDMQSPCMMTPLIARFMGPTWGPSGADRTQVGPMLAPWTLLFGAGRLNNGCRHISCENWTMNYSDHRTCHKQILNILLQVLRGDACWELGVVEYNESPPESSQCRFLSARQLSMSLSNDFPGFGWRHVKIGAQDVSAWICFELMKLLLRSRNSQAP